MDHEFDFGETKQIVYVREVAAETLPDDVREQLGDVTSMYAVHDTDGERLALVTDRKMAFMLARQNELSPVSVH
ncbi:DUF1150 family protein [Paracoccus sp. 1_MG-2023]|uniref:DUF1150 family protein n=1 Tax=unclassified Paracoccus (in: a-proteobacteria) TaxID=2688777 RepID=UPI001C0919EA|nr:MULTISPECIES: DUF1150 family protein [unclassified Paracoccus (in: a-proteobacteria)]MBU2958758.1 DUF1150 domain-containing protein [Paracoccus sp. C2R09]MDO6667751.1 DUF1150 family protein [Paracoccus sp. 1_MG-2023]